MNAGVTVNYDASGLSSGILFLQFKNRRFFHHKEMILIK